MVRKVRKIDASDPQCGAHIVPEPRVSSGRWNGKNTLNPIVLMLLTECNTESGQVITKAVLWTQSTGDALFCYRPIPCFTVHIVHLVAVTLVPVTVGSCFPRTGGRSGRR